MAASDRLTWGSSERSSHGRIPRTFALRRVEARALPAHATRFAMAVVAAGLVGCATIPADSGSDPRDPYETFNRHVTEFNDRVDRAILKPVAQAYTAVLPQGVRDCIGNIFANIADVPIALNNLLQGKPAEAVSDICRVAVNSTVGVLGCFDVASRMGLEKHNEDFGQTLGRWGMEPGPFLVLPLLGPSTIRDTLGRGVDMAYTDPVGYVETIRVRNSLTGTRVVDTRASLLDAEKIIERAALDRYLFIRNAYLQRRRSLVYDGDPPRMQDPEEEEFDQSKGRQPADQPTTEPKR